MDERLDTLASRARKKLVQQGFDHFQIHVESFLHLRYEGTDCALMCSPKLDSENSSESPKHGDFLATFLERFFDLLYYFENRLCIDYKLSLNRCNFKFIADIKQNLDSLCLIERFW